MLAAGLALYLAIFVGIGSLVHPNATAETLLIRGARYGGTAAAAHHPMHRTAVPARPPIPAAALQPAAPRRHDVHARAGARDVFASFSSMRLGNVQPAGEPVRQQSPITAAWPTFPFRGSDFSRC